MIHFFNGTKIYIFLQWNNFVWNILVWNNYVCFFCASICVDWSL